MTPATPRFARWQSWLISLVLASLCSLASFAQVPAKVWTGEKLPPHPSSDAAAATAPSPDAKPLTPLFDYPLRDTSICVGPDAYYLTGTTGHPTWWKTNEGIRVWRSTDLKKWEPLGLVWSIEKDGTWQKEFRDKNRAVWAPEIHYIKGTFWLAYCMNYGGTALLKSTTGKAEGPYQDMGKMTEGEIDASLFADDDGKVYWLYQDGKIALMKDDMSGLAEKPRKVSVPDRDYKEHRKPARFDGPGFEGAFIAKIGGKYHLLCADFINRMGTGCYDCYVAVSDNVYGPYSPRYLAVPHGGHNMFFKDRDGKWWSTFFGNDNYAVFKEQPGLLPLAFNELGMIRPDPSVILEKGPVARLCPAADIPLRDTQIRLGPDGLYYMTGTIPGFWDRNEGIKLYRSKDLKTWDDMGLVWSIEKDGTWQNNPPGGGKDRCVWAPEIHFIKGKPVIAYCMNFGKTGLLRSKSGNPEGPYESVGPLTDGIDASLFEDDDGSVYFVWAGGMYAKLKDDLSGLEGQPAQLLTADKGKVGYEGAFIVKIDGKYVLGAAEWNGDWRIDGTYDLMYAVSDKLAGPYSKRRVAVPHGGHGEFFKTADGQWYSTLFGNDRTAPFRCHPGYLPLKITAEGGGLKIEVQ